MRTRQDITSNGSFPASSWTSSYSGGASGGSSGSTGSIAVGNRVSIIEDQGTEAYGVKPVTHTIVDRKIKACWASPAYWYWAYGANRCDITSGRIPITEGTGQYGIPGVIDHSHVSVSYEKSTTELLRQAMHSFYDVNQTDNLLNVIEAHQLVTGAQSMMQVFSDVVRNRISLDNINNAFLAWQFGFAPLISDMKKIAKAVPQLRQNLRRLANAASRPRTVAVRCSGVVTTPGVSAVTHPGWSPSTNPNDGTWWHTRILPMGPCERIVGVRGTRTVKFDYDLLNEADYLLSRLVATGPASLFWEKIKFSFVVDWFVNLTGLIDLLDNSLTANGKRIDRCWVSERYWILVPAIHHRQANQFIVPMAEGYNIVDNELKYYHREPLSPDPSIGASGRFGKKQEVLLTSLSYQMVANLIKKLQRK